MLDFLSTCLSFFLWEYTFGHQISKKRSSFEFYNLNFLGHGHIRGLRIKYHKIQILNNNKSSWWTRLMSFWDFLGFLISRKIFLSFVYKIFENWNKCVTSAVQLLHSSKDVFLYSIGSKRSHIMSLSSWIFSNVFSASILLN